MDNLTGKTVLRFLALLAMMSAAIFLPAGTILFLGGWLYLIAFFGPVILITIYLFKYDQKHLARRVEAGPGAERQKNQKVIQAMASISFLMIYIIAGLDYRYHWSNIPLLISIFSDLFVVLGFYIVFLVFKENSYTSAVIEVDSEQKVITTGPYNLIRHPMYSGALLMMLSSSLALGSYWALIGVALLSSSIIFRLLDEEKFLLVNLAGYKDYCRKVHFHLIPFIW